MLWCRPYVPVETNHMAWHESMAQADYITALQLKASRKNLHTQNHEQSTSARTHTAVTPTWHSQRAFQSYLQEPMS